MGSTLTSKPVRCTVVAASCIGFSGALLRKSYSLSVRGGNLTLSLVSESTESPSSGLAPREASELTANEPAANPLVANELAGSGSSRLVRATAEEEEEEEEEKDASACSAVTSVHWMGMENCVSVTGGEKLYLLEKAQDPQRMGTNYFLKISDKVGVVCYIYFKGCKPQASQSQRCYDTT